MDILNILLLSPPLLFAGDGDEGVVPTLIGTWANVTYLQAKQPPTDLQASPAQINLQAKDT
jgi:hypothetical protein